MRYLVATRCYWNGRLYDRGEVVDLAPGVEPPEHFKAAEPVEEMEASFEAETQEAAPKGNRRRKKE